MVEISEGPPGRCWTYRRLNECRFARRAECLRNNLQRLSDDAFTMQLDFLHSTSKLIPAHLLARVRSHLRHMSSFLFPQKGGIAATIAISAKSGIKFVFYLSRSDWIFRGLSKILGGLRHTRLRFTTMLPLSCVHLERATGTVCDGRASWQLTSISFCSWHVLCVRCS